MDEAKTPNWKFYDLRFPWKMRPLSDEELATIKIEGPVSIVFLGHIQNGTIKAPK